MNTYVRKVQQNISISNLTTKWDLFQVHEAGSTFENQYTPFQQAKEEKNHV